MSWLNTLRRAVNALERIAAALEAANLRESGQVSFRYQTDLRRNDLRN